MEYTLTSCSNFQDQLSGKRSVDVREVVNGPMYILSTGCQWRAVPKDLPPCSTLFEYFDPWDYDGALDCLLWLS